MNKTFGLKKVWKSLSRDDSGTPEQAVAVNHEEAEPNMQLALTRNKAVIREVSREVFENRLQNTYKQAYNLAYRLTGNAADAEDLVQETYLRAYRFFHRYDPSLPFLNWLCRIMGNAHIDSIRRKGRVKAMSIDQIGQPGSQAFELPDWDSSPDRLVLDQSFSEHVQDGLSSISPEFRTAVLLADVEGLEYEDIAQVMNTSIGTVRSRIHRGRKQLRSFLTKRCPEFERCVDEL
jgi:RNA polymerase sigma-70 factor (ECF subfamily)